MNAEADRFSKGAAVGEPEGSFGWTGFGLIISWVTVHARG